MNVIVDVQGFKNEDNQFIPKEIAIVSKTHSFVLLIKPPYPFYNLTKKERLSVSWIERNRGILWNEGFVPYLNYKILLKDFFKNKRVYTKGYEKVLWLKDILQNSNVYNLEDNNCPSFENLFKIYERSSELKSCIYHENVCAYKNVFCLYKWCIENNVLM